MKTVSEITNPHETIGAIQAMEYGAILHTQKDGTGYINYQGAKYYATATQVKAYIDLPQVKHMKLGMYCIQKRYRQPWGDVTLYQQDKYRALDVK